MEQAKCESCHRRDDCALRDLLVLTLPFVVEAYSGSDDGEWERVHAVRRALRGTGSCPGYVEDWILAGAMEARDVDGIVREIARLDGVDLAALCRPCRHYVGPQPAVAERSAARTAA
jgi:hypothetical protein